jgi:hypothetical protein
VHAHEVVGVHEGVDEAVQHDGEVDVAVIAHLDVEPVELQREKGQNTSKCQNKYIMIASKSQRQKSTPS